MGVDCTSYRIPIHSSKIALVSFVLKFERDEREKNLNECTCTHEVTRSKKQTNKQIQFICVRRKKKKTEQGTKKM